MSQPDTGALTAAALRNGGIDVAMVDELADFDTVDDLETVRRKCLADSRIQRCTGRLRTSPSSWRIQQRSPSRARS
ncbi:hypothetical protein A5663_21450 [Mycobacterium sp. E740]|nr:hypothetical protein A5663_21450 [Mycobacterium sp. E740]